MIKMEMLFNQWKNSPRHYKNMVSLNFNEIGFRISITENDKIYATQGFVNTL
ncbi:CAP domain-containing protein [Clostridium haemolyticum]|uniref:CAP domain-containing protein n=1 Tax=Clostridium haemolyticum TaxID=84025 RepID=UPI000AC2B1B5|nr:CAP domain-containing protein [Clostridium haemolyticum]CAG7840952.1 hypothetical protein CLOHAE12215_02376 [Clostridium haemolyticum]